MSLIAFTGVPGSGKTLNATRLALKHYKKENNSLKYYITYVLSKIPKINDKFKLNLDYYKRFPKHKINNIYSNYPILLDKKYGIYSNVVSLWELNNSYSFEPNSFIVIDEIQLYADSDEYKDKEMNKRLSYVAKFFQAHRHYGISKIIITSQNPSRIFKKGRNICESYLKQCKVINLPFIPISIIRGIGYYDLEYYGRFIPRSREEKKKLPFEYYKTISFFNRKKVYRSYDSRYLSNYNYEKPLIMNGTYLESKMSYEYLCSLLED